MYSLIIYQAIAHPYFRLVRVGDGGVMVTLTGVVSKDTAWADSFNTLSKIAELGGIPVTIPATLEPGDYDLLIYDNDTPTNADLPKIARRIAWMGEEKLLPGVPISVASK